MTNLLLYGTAFGVSRDDGFRFIVYNTHSHIHQFPLPATNRDPRPAPMIHPIKAAPSSLLFSVSKFRHIKIAQALTFSRIEAFTSNELGRVITKVQILLRKGRDIDSSSHISCEKPLMIVLWKVVIQVYRRILLSVGENNNKCESRLLNIVR